MGGAAGPRNARELQSESVFSAGARQTAGTPWTACFQKLRSAPQTARHREPGDKVRYCSPFFVHGKQAGKGQIKIFHPEKGYITLQWCAIFKIQYENLSSKFNKKRIYKICRNRFFGIKKVIYGKFHEFFSCALNKS